MALRYIIEVYVDDFIAAIIPTTSEEIQHVARGILHGIHDVFPASNDDIRDPISAKKLRKGGGTFDTKSASWASSLMASKKQYGWRTTSGQPCSLSSINGYGEQKLHTEGYPSRSLNL